MSSTDMPESWSVEQTQTCHQVNCQHDPSCVHKCGSVAPGSLRGLVADAGAPGNQQGLHQLQQAVPESFAGSPVQQRSHVRRVVKGACSRALHVKRSSADNTCMDSARVWPQGTQHSCSAPSILYCHLVQEQLVCQIGHDVMQTGPAGKATDSSGLRSVMRRLVHLWLPHVHEVVVQRQEDISRVAHLVDRPLHEATRSHRGRISLPVQVSLHCPADRHGRWWRKARKIGRDCSDCKELKQFRHVPLASPQHGVL